MNKKTILALITIFLFFITQFSWASIIIPMYSTLDDCRAKSIGYIKADDTIYGLMLTPYLHHLPPGVHGFHIHAMPFCNGGGAAAGGHLDPQMTDMHAGPYNNGHLGDLPVLIVNRLGRAVSPVLAPRLKLCDIKGHSIVVAAGGDNYADEPCESGGGGMAVACGVINYY